jgi:hypothetical protein
MIFGHPPHIISQGAITTLRDIGDCTWVNITLMSEFMGFPKAPHLLPKYVPNRLLTREISYQTIEEGITSSLSVTTRNCGLNSL